MSETALTNPAETPSYISSYEGDKGLEGLSEYKLIPRLKIVQKQASSDLTKKHGVGSIILSGADITVAPCESGSDESEPFTFIPVVFFPQWIVLSDLKDKQSSTILDKTSDPNSPLVEKARSKTLRVEEYGDQNQFKKRYVEVLNFMIVIVGDSELAGSTAIMSFAKGEHITGMKLCSFFDMRKAPLCSHVMRANSSLRTNDGYEWHGFDITDERWATEDEFKEFSKIAETAREDVQKMTLDVKDDDPSDLAEDSTNTDSEM